MKKVSSNIQINSIRFDSFHRMDWASNEFFRCFWISWNRFTNFWDSWIHIIYNLFEIEYSSNILRNFILRIGIKIDFSHFLFISLYYYFLIFGLWIIGNWNWMKWNEMDFAWNQMEIGQSEFSWLFDFSRFLFCFNPNKNFIESLA